MASNVVSDNFETGSGGVPQLGGTGATTCKAWVNFNGTGTVAIRDSYNVSSITDLSTGKYRVNMTNAMANVNYSATVTASADGGDYTWFNGACTFGTAFATTWFDLYTVKDWATLYDTDIITAVVFGD